MIRLSLMDTARVRTCTTLDITRSIRMDETFFMGRVTPLAAAAIRFALLLGLVLIESLAFYTLVVTFGRYRSYSQVPVGGG
jgi:hypothetical protein